MSEIKLCKDCKWFKPALEFYTLQQMAYNQSIDGIRMVAPQPRGVMCVRPDLMLDDLVNGGLVPFNKANSDPEWQRNGDCGREAKYFEPKPVLVAPPVNCLAGLDPCVPPAKPWWRFW